MEVGQDPTRGWGMKGRLSLKRNDGGRIPFSTPKRYHQYAWYAAGRAVGRGV